MSTFHGLEMAKQALFAQQSALYTTGHNISNANTEGYSRQRVNFEASSPFPTASRNRPQIPGQMGTGVQAGSIERVRDHFLDTQFRGENNKAGYWQTKSAALSRMENVMNETTDKGLAKSMDLFRNSLQDLATNPQNSGARSVVVQRGIALAETFNYLSTSLTDIRGDLQSELNHTVETVNSLMNQINEINQQVKQIEPHGYVANDLYDERDRLIDELSGIVNIKVTYSESGDGAIEAADGLATIELVQDGDNITLINGEDLEYQALAVDYDDDLNTVLTVNGEEQVIDTSTLTGSLNALVHAHDQVYPDMLANLDAMAETLVENFNHVHGFEGESGVPFFDPEALEAGTIKVNADIIDHPSLIKANLYNDSDDGENALELANIFDAPVDIDGNETSIKKYYESIIGDLGVNAQEANRMTDNTSILRSQVDNQRMSVSSVSLDEEMSNMIKFQHAYNAAARSMTAMDEMLDKIINGMGIVGR